MRPFSGLVALCGLLMLNACGASSSHRAPELILPELRWSIAEPVPGDLQAFRSALVEYASEIEAEQDFSEFDLPFPGLAVDIQYTYGVQAPSGQWDHLTEIVRIRSDRPLTQGELVLRLHQAAHRHLVDQDHHFFEGLELMPRSLEPGVPAYELVTGS